MNLVPLIGRGLATIGARALPVMRNIFSRYIVPSMSSIKDAAIEAVTTEAVKQGTKMIQEGTESMQGIIDNVNKNRALKGVDQLHGKRTFRRHLRTKMI